MGGEGITIPITATGLSAKYADAYEWAWGRLQRTLEVLGVEPESPLREYLGEVRGRAAQQRILKTRPYGKKEFTYFFPSYSGMAATAAALCAHWLRIAIVLSERDDYTLRKSSVRLAHQYDVRTERARERFIQLRGYHWEISDGAEGARLRRHGDETEITGEELAPDERERVNQAKTLHCACAICDAITPTQHAEERMLALLDGRLDVESTRRFAFWIASLLDPLPALVAALATRMHRVYALAGSSAYGSYSPSNAVYLLAKRCPAVAAALRDAIGSSDTCASAVALHAARAEAEADPTWVTSRPDLIASAIGRSREEAVPALELLRVVLLAVRESTDWSTAILVAVQRFGHNTQPGAFVVDWALVLWCELHGHEGTYPPPVVEMLESIRTSYPANHLGAIHVAKMLAK